MKVLYGLLAIAFYRAFKRVAFSHRSLLKPPCRPVGTNKNVNRSIYRVKILMLNNQWQYPLPLAISSALQFPNAQAFFASGHASFSLPCNK